jgi:hypothetical protein
VEMTLRGQIGRTLLTNSSAVPGSLETRTERGFPHSHSDDCSDEGNLTNVQKQRKPIRFTDSCTEPYFVRLVPLKGGFPVVV